MTLSGVAPGPRAARAGVVLRGCTRFRAVVARVPRGRAAAVPGVVTRGCGWEALIECGGGARTPSPPKFLGALSGRFAVGAVGVCSTADADRPAIRSWIVPPHSTPTTTSAAARDIAPAAS